MLINPYKTALGVHTPTKKLEITLNDFMLKSNDVSNLNYEYSYVNDIEMVFITGKNETEMDLPIWNHPIFIKDFKGRNRIFIDIRSMVNVRNKEFLLLSDVVTNKTAFDFTIVRTIFMASLAGDRANLDMISNNIALAFGKWITSAIKVSLSISVEDAVNVEIAALHYIYSVLLDEEQSNNDNVAYKISTNLKVVKGNIKYINNICKDFNYNPRDAVDLVENISKAVNTPLLRNFDTAVLYNVLNNTWTGINANENIVMSIEHIPTLIGIIYTSLSSKNLKHSKLANILNSAKRDIKSDELLKRVELIIEDYKL